MPLSDIPGMPPIRGDRVLVGALAATILLVAAVVAVAHPEALRRSGERDRQLVPAPLTTPRPGATFPGPIGRGTAVAPGPAPTAGGAGVGAGPTSVGGSASSLDASGANLTVATPFTISSAERGSGNGATITGALVGGKEASIAWDAGQPLPFTGQGAIVLVGVALHGDAAGLVPQLGGRTFALAPGRYHLGSDVAISTPGGLPQPQAGADFTATGATRITFQRQATLLAPYPSHLTGPGGVRISGALRVATANTTSTAREVRLDNGPFVLDLSPGRGAVSVEAKLQGAVTVCPADANAACATTG